MWGSEWGLSVLAGICGVGVGMAVASRLVFGIPFQGCLVSFLLEYMWVEDGGIGGACGDVPIGEVLRVW